MGPDSCQMTHSRPYGESLGTCNMCQPMWGQIASTWDPVTTQLKNAQPAERECLGIVGVQETLSGHNSLHYSEAFHVAWTEAAV